MKIPSFEDILKVLSSEVLTPEGIFNCLFLGSMIYIYVSKPDVMIDDIMKLNSQGAAFSSTNLQDIYTQEIFVRAVLLLFILIIGIICLIIVHRSFMKHGSVFIQRFFNIKEGKKSKKGRK